MLVTRISDNRGKFTLLSDGILKLYRKISACIIIRLPEGSIIAESVRPEYYYSLASLTKRTDGMIGQWAVLAYSIMGKLEKAGSKMKCIVFGRENDKGMLFSANVLGGIMIGLTLQLDASQAEISRLVMKFAGEVQ